MGRVSRDLHRRKRKKLYGKLTDLLSRVDDAGFLQLTWAVDMLQSSFGTEVRRYLEFPKEAATTDMASASYVYKWDLESLLLLLLSTPKYVVRPGFNRVLDCRKFGAMAQAVNLLRSLENSESAVMIDGSDIFMELHRIGQRQFAWQRGFATSERLYRFAFVYGQGDCAAFFQEAHGLSIAQFMKVSFILWAQLHRVPWTKPPDLRTLGIDAALLEKSLALIARPLPETRSAVKELIDAATGKGRFRVAYLPSALRQFPIIQAPEHGTIISPLPQLIMLRATAGLYYDFRNGPQNLTTEANNRFELYTRKVIEAFCPRLEALPSEPYGPKKARVDTPDVMLKDKGQVVAIIECKATKLTYEAQFADNPIEAAEGAYNQIVKGVTQLWRFISHVRRGIYEGQPLADNVHAIVLTMESWMQVSEGLQDQVLSRAKKLVMEDPEITEADMRPVIFCSIQDLIDVMFISTEDDLLGAFANAELPKYKGWGFREVRRDSGAPEMAKPFPLKVEELLPWWGKYVDPPNGQTR